MSKNPMDFSKTRPAYKVYKSVGIGEEYCLGKFDNLKEALWFYQTQKNIHKHYDKESVAYGTIYIRICAEYEIETEAIK